jgi:hypothetical protein
VLTKKQRVKLSKVVENKAKKRSKEIMKQENETFRNELTEILNTTHTPGRGASLSRNKMITPQFFLKKKKDDKDMGPGHTNNTVYCSEDNKMLGLGGKNDEGQAKLDGYAPPPSIGPSNSLKIKKNNTYEKYLIKNNYHAPTKNPAH